KTGDGFSSTTLRADARRGRARDLRPASCSSIQPTGAAVAGLAKSELKTPPLVWLKQEHQVNASVAVGRSPRANYRTQPSLPVAEGESLKRLWREYQRTHDKALRNRLLLPYAPLVKFVAGRLGSRLPTHVDKDDLI